MIKNLLRFSVLFSLSTVLLTLYSCQSSQDVVSGKLIQKRKHRPGFHFNLKQSSHQKENYAEQKEQMPRRRDSLIAMESTAANALKKFRPIQRLAENKSLKDERALHEQLNSFPPPPSQRPKSSLLKEAELRTAEIEDLNEAIERNEKNLMITGILSFFGLLSYIGYYAAVLLGSMLVPYLAIPALILSTVLPYSLPLFLIYIVERFKLKKGEVFFDQRRVAGFEDTTVLMKRIQMIAFIASVSLAIGFILGLVFAPPLGILALIGLTLSYTVFSVTSWIGIIVGLLNRRYSETSRKALIQLITVQVLGNIVAVLIALILILLFVMLLGLVII